MCKKILSFLIIIVVALNLAGCASSSSKIEYKKPSVIKDANETKDIESSNTPNSTGGVSPKEGTAKSSREMLKEDIFESFTLSKNEILEKLGDNYEIVQAGAEGSFDGYRYDELGVTFVFEEDGKVLFVNCDEKFDINGAKAGMNFAQVQEKLGKGEIEETWFETPDNKAYKIEYMIDSIVIRFLSFEKDGSESSLTIFMKKD